MARPSKLTPDQWPRPTNWETLMHRLRGSMDNEDSAVDQLRLQLVTQTLHLMIDCAPITGYKFEFSLGRYGIADLLLYHADGGYTLVEAKGPGTIREACAGIGQLFAYEAGLRDILHQENNMPPYINKALCAPLPSVTASVVGDVCATAGVKFVVLLPADLVRDLTVENACGA